MSKISEFNAKTWDQWSEDDFIWTVPFSVEQFAQAKNREIELILTPMKKALCGGLRGWANVCWGLPVGAGSRVPN